MRHRHVMFGGVAASSLRLYVHTRGGALRGPGRKGRQRTAGDGDVVQVEEDEEASGSEADGDVADGDAGDVPASAEDVLLQEMEGLRAREVAVAKRSRKKRREMKKRAKIRLAQAAATGGIGEEADEGEEALFSLGKVRGTKGLAAAGAASAVLRVLWLDMRPKQPCVRAVMCLRPCVSVPRSRRFARERLCLGCRLGAGVFQV